MAGPLHERHAIASKRRPFNPRASSSSRPAASAPKSLPIPANRLHNMHARNVSNGGDSLDSESSATFLQYCTICEKQIPVPNFDVLYCSEDCREQDNAESPNYPLFQVDIEPAWEIPEQHYSPHDPSPFRDILPQRTPTAIYQHNPLANAWPHTASSPEATSSLTDRHDAAHHQTHSYTYSNASPPTHRPSLASATSNVPLPSLSQTSFSPALSIPATPLSTSSPQRPLRPRTNPLGSSTSFSSRSIHLVTPISHAAMTSTSWQASSRRFEDGPAAGERHGARLSPPGGNATFAIDEEDGGGVYEKIPPLASLDGQPGRGGLKQLFAFDKMRS